MEILRCLKCLNYPTIAYKRQPCDLHILKKIECKLCKRGIENLNNSDNEALISRWNIINYNLGD